MKKLLVSLAALLAFFALAAYLAINTVAGQDFLLARAVALAAAAPDELEDGLHVFVCGSAAPMPAPDRAQACIAVLTPEHYFIVDAGAGSANNLGLEQLPSERLSGVFLTHFHSDHISELPTINVVSWASGRKGPMKLYGPRGVERIADGFNMAFTDDRRHRMDHHGREFMPEVFGVMQGIEISETETLEFGALKIRAFPVNHSPINPAVGYRFDYKGRSVVITGDTLVTDTLREASTGADLLLSDALSLPIVQALQKASTDVGRDRIAKILGDIQDYHASAASVVELTKSTDIGMTALYHLVPGPRNAVMENIFKRGFTDNMLLTKDRMWFVLPASSSEIQVRR
ncbi:MAG: MBL fold metallo-hydrolase [Pseudomonadota bacterium]